MKKIDFRVLMLPYFSVSVGGNADGNETLCTLFFTPPITDPSPIYPPPPITCSDPGSGCNAFDVETAGGDIGCHEDAGVCDQINSVCEDRHVDGSGNCESNHVCAPDSTSVWIGGSCSC
jgi:hypothetical protein